MGMKVKEESHVLKDNRGNTWSTSHAFERENIVIVTIESILRGWGELDLLNFYCLTEGFWIFILNIEIYGFYGS